MSEQLDYRPSLAEQRGGSRRITNALDRLEPVDPELIDALRQAREAGAITSQFFRETITGNKEVHDQPEGVALTLLDLSDYPESAQQHVGEGLMISVHDWVDDEHGARTLVTGNIRMTEDGALFPSTELIYPTSDPDKPGRHGNVTRTVRPYRGRSRVTEERKGEGNPQRIRAMAINTAHKILEQSRAGQTPDVPDDPEAAAA